METEKAIMQIDGIIDDIEETNIDKDTKIKLEKIRNIIDDINS